MIRKFSTNSCRNEAEYLVLQYLPVSAVVFIPYYKIRSQSL